MLEGILARVADAALPFVAGRRLLAVEETLADDLSAWADEQGTECVAVIGAGSSVDLAHKLSGVTLPPGTIVIVLQPATAEPVVLPGWSVVDTQYTFPDAEGIAEPRAVPTLPPDERWTAGRNAGGVWLDCDKPEKFLACITIARVGG
jgi:hypothetical protein